MATEKKFQGTEGLEQIAAEVHALMDAHDTGAESHGDLRGRIDDFAAEHNNSMVTGAIVPYWGESDEVEIGRVNYPAESVSVVRKNGTVTLNGTTTGRIRVTLSGDLMRTATDADFNALERTVEFTEGHLYRIDIQKLSGSYTGTDVRCIVYGAGDSIGSAQLDDSTGRGSGTFTWPGGTGIVAWRILVDTAFDNAELCCVITDVTERKNQVVYNGSVHDVSYLISRLVEFPADMLPYIEANEDFNNYLTPGSWRVGSAATMTTLANRPCDSGGRLFVIALIQASRLTQIYMPLNNAGFYQRYYYGTNDDGTPKLTAWDKCALSSEVPEVEALTEDEINEICGSTVGDQTVVDQEAIVQNTLERIGDTYATKASVTELSEEIDSISVPTKVSALENDAGYIDDSTLAAELAKRGQLKPEFANGIEDCTDTSKLYVLPDGYIYAYMKHETTTEGSTTPNFTNLLDNATINLNKRYNSSNTLKDANGYIAVEITGIASGDVLRFKPASLAQGVSGGSQRFRLYNSAGTLLSNGDTPTGDEYTLSVSDDVASMTVPSYGSAVAYARANLYVSSSAVTDADLTDLIITANQEITYTTVEGGTTITSGWASTGHAFVPADYEDRIAELEGETDALNESVSDLEADVEALKARPVSSTISTMVYAPSPQLPADGSDTADFDAANINANEIYDYIDALAAKHPRYLTKETLGKDESGEYDWNRYIASRRTYDAWMLPNYPAMYGWTNGSTTVYSVSVSPRVGDTMYSTAYVGTAYSTVTAVDNANQTRTVNGLTFTRNTEKDVEPELVYTYSDYNPYRLDANGDVTWRHNAVYNASQVSIGTIASMEDGTLVDSNGDTYNRYPMGDRNRNFDLLPAIVIGANEHGGNVAGDPAEPAIITARLIKDMCENRYAENVFLNMLKSEYRVIFCPIINPWGYGKESGYVNANGVNLDRNFDTPGWGNDTDTRHGDYGGSENETQYFMATLWESGAKIALANHALGGHTNTGTGEAANAGVVSYMFGRNNSKYNAHLLQIAETMSTGWGLQMYDMGQAPGDTYGKTRSYMDHIGVEGGAVEMTAIEGYLLHGGARHTAQVMEADYTLLLQFLHMLIECQE